MTVRIQIGSVTKPPFKIDGYALEIGNLYKI
jgi:hypothetical protein